MAVTPEADFYRKLGPGKNEQRISSFKPTRLTGDLAAATVIAASGSANEVVPCHGLSRVRVRYKLTGTALNELVTIAPALAGATQAVATAAVAGVETDNAAVSGTETSQEIDLYGEEYLVITIAEQGGANAITVDYVEVQGL